MPLAVTIHDISFVAHPEWFRAARRHAAPVADAAGSRDGGRDFHRFGVLALGARTPPPRSIRRGFEVIPPGVTAPPPAGRAGMRREPLVLFVGSLFNRRRLPDLIAAFAMRGARHPDARLVIVGDDRTWPRQDLRGGRGDRTASSARTEFRSYVADEALADLYARASVFAFLSEYEGFGLTPLEALAAGVPAIVLDTPVAREVYGDAANLREDAAMSRGLPRRFAGFCCDPASAAPVLSHAPAVLGRYSWDTRGGTDARRTSRGLRADDAVDRHRQLQRPRAIWRTVWRRSPLRLRRLSARRRGR